MQNRLRMLALSSIFALLAAPSTNAGAGAADTPFHQEFHEPYVIGDGPGVNDVRTLAVDRSGSVWAGTRAGLYVLRKGERRWTPLMKADEAGPVFDIAIADDATVWIGAWNGVYRSTAKGIEKIAGIDQPVAALCPTGQEVFALGPDGMWRIRAGQATRHALPCARSIHAVACDADGSLWIATAVGLYHYASNGVTLYQNEEDILSAEVHDLAFAADGSLWVGGLGGLTIYKRGKRVRVLVPEDGLPTGFVTCVSRGPDGRMWVGTTSGVARYNGKTWSLRHSRRWLLNDEVRDVAFDADGTAWVATAAGVSAIKRKEMTLAAKAGHYLEVCLARHVREPGLVEKCTLTIPGDTSNWQPRDDDNDGQYTAMYLAMESFRYAVTKDAKARTNAKKAFDAQRFLQTVTETPGFVARTVVPASWTGMADPNETMSEQQWAERRVRDPRSKRVAQRWRPSKDGKWLWKGDTSSDEITGHFFGYVFYYDLVADDAEKEVVRAHVRRMMDYIIDGGYVLKDIDGTHTRWAVWSPEKLNGDPDWAPERGVNSVEILSFLKATYHMTGDEKYQQHYLRLLREHGYLENVRFAKTLNPSWRTHIDDELLALAYPGLLLYEKDPDLRRVYRESLDHWYAAVKDDQSPFLNFVYGSLAGKDAELDESIAFLRDNPLDLVRWRVDNSRREDVRLRRFPETGLLQTDRVLPASERGIIRWDGNPFQPVEGDDGETESDGVFWLLPYWMGRYYGFIKPPQ